VSEKHINFRIGVTGHRDIPAEDVDAARQHSDDFLTSLQASMPGTGITVISGLAEGADRIFAEAALALGIKVEAVLPMPLAHYKNDFDESSCLELQRLLEIDSVQRIELPLTPGLDADESSWPQGARDALYANLSENLRLRSNVLVTFWDGKFNFLTGGTGDTLMAYLDVPSIQGENEVKFIEVDTALLNGGPLAYWIPVQRRSSEQLPTDSSGKHEPRWLSASGENIRWWSSAPSDLEQELAQFDQFNQHHAEFSSSESLISYGNLLDNCADVLESDVQQFEAGDRAYVMADSLALYHQTRSDRLFKLFSMMAATMGLLFLVYAKLAAVQWLLIGYLALFFGGVFLHAKGGNKEWFTRHLVYRCLAETLRVRFYLNLAGAHSRVDIQELLQTTGISNFQGFSWIRYVLRSTRPVLDPASLTPDVANSRIEAVRLNWIEDQSRYFHRKTHGLHRHHHKLEKIKQWVVGGLVVAAIVLVFFKKTLVGIDLGGHLTLKTLLIFFMGLLPFWLGVWEIYQNKMAIKELTWQYRNQWERFSSIDEMLKQSRQLEFQRDTIARLGEISIIESCLWIIQRYHRDHEPPTAG
jgi:hypothetical protein